MRNSANRYDIVILGGGSAGIVSGVMAGGLGMRVLLIEKSKMGGECLNTGCVPSKALLHAARVAHALRTAHSIGFQPMSVAREDAAGVMQHVRNTIKTVRDADATEELLRRYGVEIRYGAASFRDAGTLLLADDTIHSANFILATGSRPAVPDIPGLEKISYLTNQSLFDLDAIPPALLILGGGPVGVEMAQAFQRLGSQVTLLQRAERLLPRDDAELSEALTACLRQEGIDIRLGATPTKLRKSRGRCVVTIEQGGVAAEIGCDALLIATGRKPNIEGLQLEAAGVAFDSNGVKVDHHLRTAAPNIYACGDILGRYQFSHMAEYEAKIAVRNIVFPGAVRASFRMVPWTTFTDPEVAHVGLTEEEARAQGIAYEVYRQPFAQDDRALTDNEGIGFVKVLAQGIRGKILGAHIIGPRAGELMQEWIAAMEYGRSIRDIADLIHVYPTLSMANQHAAQRWYESKAAQPPISGAIQTYAHVIRPRQGAITIGLLGAGLTGIGIGLTRVLASRKRRY